MTDELVKFETAKLAKEKGFDGHTGYDHVGWHGFVYYHKDIGKLYNSANIEYFANRIAAPTQSLLQRWLREKHKIHVLPSVTCNIEGSIYFCSITSFFEDSLKHKWIEDEEFKELKEIGIRNYKIFKTYEQALEQGLLEALKLIS